VGLFHKWRGRWDSNPRPSV